MEQKNVTQVINNHYLSPQHKKIAFRDARFVNETFRDLIEAVRKPAGEPSTEVIDFMNELRDRVARQVYVVPTEYLRFRKSNGRIIADVESYEKQYGYVLEDQTDETQELLRTFLSRNDGPGKKELKKLLSQKGQQRPAIATCDGYLVNGNRRKMALEELYNEADQDARFQTMRVVFLPEGVSELEIQKVENRYQLQSEGKLEYHVLNKAIKYKRNIEFGFHLEAQLRDDPNYHETPPVEFRRIVKGFEQKFIHPLACLDRYLLMLGREGMYTSVTGTSSSREGLWQTFVQYSKVYSSVLSNSERVKQLGLEDQDIEKVEAAVFNLIRGHSSDMTKMGRTVGKPVNFIRNLSHYLEDAEAKAYVFRMAGIPRGVLSGERDVTDDPKEIDEIWTKLYGKELSGYHNAVQNALSNNRARAKPLEQLENALELLKRSCTNIRQMGPQYFERSMELAQVIGQKTEEIFKEIDYARFNYRRSGSADQEFPPEHLWQDRN